MSAFGARTPGSTRLSARPDVIGQIISRKQAIRAAMHDPERAHSLERTLWAWTLEQIADGNCNGSTVKACAAEALASRSIEFPRRFA